MTKFQRGEIISRKAKDFQFYGTVLGTVQTLKGNNLVIAQAEGFFYMALEDELTKVEVINVHSDGEIS